MTNLETVCKSCGAELDGRYCGECGTPASDRSCPRCASPLPPTARFCHTCGLPLLGKTVPAPRVPFPLMIVGGIAIVAAIGVLLIRTFQTPSGGDTVTQPPVTATAPPDISSMTPRERAQRLFARIAATYESGDTSGARFFAPMAMQAYAALGRPDNDALYDTGMIFAYNAQFEEALRNADSLDGRVRGHLLASMLRATVGRITADDGVLSAARRSFLDNYDRETGQSRGEYQVHQSDIESFRAEAREALGESQ